MTEPAVDVATVAAHLGIHPQTVYTHAKAGTLPGFRVGRSWRFYLTQIDAHLNRAADPWVNSKKPRGRNAA